jgi:hypothetical protein
MNGHLDLILALLALGYLALAGSIWNEKARRRRDREDEQASRQRVVREMDRRDRRGPR